MTRQFDGTVHLLLSKQFKTIHRQARLEVFTEGLPVKTITLSKLNSTDIMPEIHLSLQEFNNQVIESQQSNVYLVNSAFQISLDSLSTEDCETHTRPSSKDNLSQKTTIHSLPFPANAHTPVQVTDYRS